MADAFRPKISIVTGPERNPTDSDNIVIRLRDFLELPEFIQNAVADHPVIASNFYYENTFHPLAALLYGAGAREARILGTSGADLKRSSSKLGDYKWIKRTDPFVDSAIFVVHFRTWKRVLSFREIY